MSTLKSILVHVDSSAQSAVRLRLAEQLALAHGAQATAMYAVTTALLRYPMAMAAGAAWLDRQLPDTTRIWVSPARRTQQTAAALGRKFKLTEALSTQASVKQLLELTMKINQLKRLLNISNGTICFNTPQNAWL